MESRKQFLNKSLVLFYEIPVQICVGISGIFSGETTGRIHGRIFERISEAIPVENSKGIPSEIPDECSK